MQQVHFLQILLCCASLLRTYRYADAEVAVVTGEQCSEPIGNWCRLTGEWNSNHLVARTDFVRSTNQRSQNSSALDRYGSRDSHSIKLTEYTIRLTEYTTRLTEYTYAIGESLSQPGCSPGTYSENFEKYSCRPCPKGMFSDKPGAIACEKCPSEMKTMSLGAKFIENCTCDISVCYHGKCLIQSDYTTMCVCNAGFRGKNCQNPTQFVIGAAIGTLVLVAFLYCADRIRKHRKASSSRG